MAKRTNARVNGIFTCVCSECAGQGGTRSEEWERWLAREEVTAGTNAKKVSPPDVPLLNLCLSCGGKGYLYNTDGLELVRIVGDMCRDFLKSAGVEIDESTIRSRRKEAVNGSQGDEAGE